MCTKISYIKSLFHFCIFSICCVFNRNNADHGRKWRKKIINKIKHEQIINCSYYSVAFLLFIRRFDKATRDILIQLMNDFRKFCVHLTFSYNFRNFIPMEQHTMRSLNPQAKFFFLLFLFACSIYFCLRFSIYLSIS